MLTKKKLQTKLLLFQSTRNQKSEEILPGMLEEGQDWTDVAFIELMMKTAEEGREPFILFRYPNLILSTSSWRSHRSSCRSSCGSGWRAYWCIGLWEAIMGGAAGSVAGLTVEGVAIIVSWMKKK